MSDEPWKFFGYTAYMRRYTGQALVKVKAYHLFSTKPLPGPILTYLQSDGNRSERPKTRMAKEFAPQRTFIHI